LDGATGPPAGAPNHFFELFTNTTMQQWDFHVDFVNTANSTFTGPKTITISNWTQICTTTRACIAQPSPGEKLDSLGDRLMYRAGSHRRDGHDGSPCDRGEGRRRTDRRRQSLGRLQQHEHRFL